MEEDQSLFRRIAEATLTCGSYFLYAATALTMTACTLTSEKPLVTVAEYKTFKDREDREYVRPVETLEEALKTGRIQKQTIEEARKTGAAPVIVQLNLPTPYRPEYELTEVQVAQQRAAIAKSQTILLQNLGVSGVKGVKRLTVTPYLALHADAAALTILVQHSAVRRVMVDRIMKPFLNNTTPLIGASNVQSALGNAGAGQTIAILDTGVDLDHPFFGGRIVAEACYSDNGGWFSSKDSVCPGGVEETAARGSGDACTGITNCDHGTHVAGIAAGSGSNFSGVAPAANIIAIQVFHRENDPATCNQNQRTTVPCLLASTSDVLRGLEHVYVLRNIFDIAAVNLSLGWGFYTSRGRCDDDNPDYRDIVDCLRGAGIATVAASGNSAAMRDANGKIIGYQSGIAVPACVSSVISVGETNNRDVVQPTSQGGSLLLMLAPGSGVNSSVTGGGFGLKPGTSQASPHVAGAFAVLSGLDPRRSIENIRDRLIATGQPVLDNRPGFGITHARLQLDAAVEDQEIAPLAPSNLQLLSSTGKTLTVQWRDNSLSETRFKVVAAPQSTESHLTERSGHFGKNIVSGTLSRLEPNTQYSVIARACDSDDRCSAYSDPLPVTTLDTLPSAPTNFRAGTVTEDSIQVLWDSNSVNPVTFFRMGHNTNTQGSWVSGRHAANMRSATFTNLDPGSGYSFWIMACNADGCTGQVSLHVKTLAIDMPSPAAPTDLHVCGARFRELCHPDRFTLIWRDNADNEDRYELHWAIAQPDVSPWDARWNVIPLRANSRSHTGLNLTSGLMYHFWVQACNTADDCTGSAVLTYMAP